MDRVVQLFPQCDSAWRIHQWVFVYFFPALGVLVHPPCTLSSGNRCLMLLSLMTGFGSPSPLFTIGLFSPPALTSASTWFTVHLVAQPKAYVLRKLSSTDSPRHSRAHWLPTRDVASLSPLFFTTVTTLSLSTRCASLSTVLSKDGRHLIFLSCRY